MPPDPDSTSDPVRPPRRTGAGFPAATTLMAGALTLSGSEAAIVYINYSNQVLADPTPNNGASAFFPFDFNGDGAADLRFMQRIDASSSNFAGVVAASGGRFDAIGLIQGAYRYPARLAANQSIGPSAFFITFSGNAIGSMAFGNGFTGSQWAGAAPTNTGYLAIRFNAGTNQHYGWVRLTVGPNSGAQPRAITVHEAAYESVPGGAIAAGAIPEPGGLGLLALGGTGILMHRRRRSL